MICERLTDRERFARVYRSLGTHLFNVRNCVMAACRGGNAEIVEMLYYSVPRCVDPYMLSRLASRLDPPPPPKCALAMAIPRNRVAVAEYLMEQGETMDYSHCDVFKTCGELGYLDIVTCMLDRIYALTWKREKNALRQVFTTNNKIKLEVLRLVLEGAVSAANMPVIDFVEAQLKQLEPDTTIGQYMAANRIGLSKAVASGDLVFVRKVIEWVGHGIRENLEVQVIDWKRVVERKCSIEFIEWALLHGSGDEMDPLSVIREAVVCDRLDLVKWIVANRPEVAEAGWTSMAGNMAVIYQRMDILAYLHEECGVKVEEMTRDYREMSLDIFEYVASHRTKDRPLTPSHFSINKWSERRWVEAVKLAGFPTAEVYVMVLIANLDVSELIKLADSGNVPMTQILTSGVRAVAAQKGCLDHLQWLLGHHNKAVAKDQYDLELERLLLLAAQAGHIEVAKYLIETEGATVRDTVILDVILINQLPMLKYLLSRNPEALANINTNAQQLLLVQLSGVVQGGHVSMVNVTDQVLSTKFGEMRASNRVWVCEILVFV
eukprot:gene15977-18999_t